MIDIVICDDNLSYHEILTCKIQQCIHNNFSMECCIKSYSNLDDLKIHLENNKTDIIFLDIMVNDVNAMDWSIENIKSKYTQIIFMTSFPQCAYNISEANCCYFLVKSRLTDENLAKAIKRALRKTTKKDPNLTTVKLGSKSITINSQDIIYIETFDNNITLHLKDKDNITIYSSLKDYAERLPANFLRCHKSYMINMNHIAGYKPHKFIINSGETIPIPPKKYKQIIKIYENYLLNI